ncbi:MAG TPA: G5 domain-containing protein, partial [Candidatus Intestinimonas stercoravium]|nr:G5 domain-containing protein [Candidatus Intestinimonas stercoravium]
DYPIKLVTSYQNSKLTVQIHGTKVDDTYVKMTNKVLSSTPWETEYKVDPSLPAGSTKTEQTPYTGYVAEAYRNIYSGDGELISSTLESKNTYRSRNKIVLVSPADAANYGLSTDGLPLPSPDPATVESPAAESPVPSETAEAPAESPAVSESPAPSETAEAPAESPAASESPAPSDTAEAPADSSAVSESPAPSETPAESPEAASTQVPDIGIPISSAALEDMAEAAEGGDR